MGPFTAATEPGTEIDLQRVMTKHDTTHATQISGISGISGLDLGLVVGAANLDFAAIRQQAQAYCPNTAARYGTVNPASVTRPVAQRMGNECLTEMGTFKATFARGPIQSAIDHAFPK
jgi:hypothetical protein